MAALRSRLPPLPPCLQASNDVSSEDYDSQIRDFVTRLQRSLSTEASTIRDADDSRLDDIDPFLHSIPYLLILHSQVRYAQSKAGGPLPRSVRPGGRLWPKAVRLLRNFDPIQVRYVGQEWRELVELVGQAAQASSKARRTPLIRDFLGGLQADTMQPLLAVPLVRGAILRLDPSGTTFTSNHLLLTELCLHSKAYSHALPVLDKYICHFPPGPEQAYLKYDQPLLCARHESSAAFITGASGLSAKLAYRDYLQYFLYGGMIYMAVKEWDKALHFFNIVISSPVVNSVSLVMVEAYKKWILVSLLRNGELRPSGMITSHVMRVYQSLAKPYVALANAFKSGNLQRLNSEIELGQPVWESDNNTGLVSQVVGAFHRHKLLRLGRSFAALTVADVARSMSPYIESAGDAESFVASLITSGALNATLSHLRDDCDSTMLHFAAAAPRPRMLQDTHVQAQLAQGVQVLRVLTGSIKESNRALELNDDYIDHLKRNQRRAETFKGRASTGDEDIMGDIH